MYCLSILHVLHIAYVHWASGMLSAIGGRVICKIFQSPLEELFAVIVSHSVGARLIVMLCTTPYHLILPGPFGGTA
ncbi:hypothetical protein GGS24DRAFT_468482 [Hypoxylon argillaceum]|nr:hypothetical protein GGS24DRAFT_468482 [Hypoxylon argillaceum]KAI1148497.1 hypothetical protein F4825DRAFT_433767 [Nemania diffusa]